MQASGTDAETTSTTNPHLKNDANANADAFLVKDLHTRKSHENGEIGRLLAETHRPRPQNDHDINAVEMQTWQLRDRDRRPRRRSKRTPRVVSATRGVKADEYKQAGEREYEQRETSRHTLATAQDIHKAGNVDEMRNEQ
ncbi:hypothetical protein PLEOSDRAFT_1105340 [Pleurotus ostreatus PC15]|uniref:Uncharacterized protein n=1 Tax=Pleurotus ostreatus (strain PC15) TaxID=1137138 RepID=A0A067NS31_PLEO1|nr:hypothetical protein PLEOSDRAFT_1105340 [Pleurotus ostreatus PC15]